MAATHETLSRLNLGERIKPGESVAISAGSRGIANIANILKAIVDHLKSLGACPFIVPAMGSHGGGTAEGQLKVLRGYAITPEFCGCEIRASMETVVVSQAAEGFPVHFDKHACGADHVFVAGRIKPMKPLHLVRATMVAGLLVGSCASGYALITDRNPFDVASSGTQTLTEGQAA